MMVAAKVAAPVLLTALLVGFLISLFQAATQIQEPTLSFVPKMIAVAIALLVTGNWVLAELVSFTQSLFDSAAPAARPDLTPMDLSVPAVTLAALLLGTARATGFVLLAPPFNSRTIPAPVKGALALALSLLLSTQIAPDAARADGRLPRRRRGDRGGHRRGAGLRRPGAVHRRPDGRRPASTSPAASRCSRPTTRWR